MQNLAQTLKQEIARIVRKELRKDVTALRKAASGYRSEIAALKRAMKDLQVQLRATQRGFARSAPPQSQEGAAPRAGRKASFSAERLKEKRLALGLSQAQMAALLEISSVSQWKWESGQVTPRAAKLARYFEVMAMGKREVAKVLEAS